MSKNVKRFVKKCKIYTQKRSKIMLKTKQNKLISELIESGSIKATCKKITFCNGEYG